MFCTKCGKQNPDGMRFCQYCGTPLMQGGQQQYQQNGAQQSQYQQNGYQQNGYQQSQYQQADAYVSYAPPLSPVAQALRQMGGSAVFLTAAVAYTCAILFTIIGGFVGSSNSVLASYLALAEQMGGMVDYGALNTVLGAMRGASVMSTILMEIPAILVAVGIWLTFATVRNNGSAPMQTGGLTLIRVLQIIGVVFECVALVLLEVALIISMVAASQYTDMAVPVLATAMALILLIMGLGILYNVKLIQTLGTIRLTMQTQRPSTRISTYAAVMTIIGGVASLVSIFSAGNIFSSLGLLCSAVASIVFGVFLFQYRNRMQVLKMNRNDQMNYGDQGGNNNQNGYNQNGYGQNENGQNGYNQNGYGQNVNDSQAGGWQGSVGETQVLQQAVETTVLHPQTPVPTVRLIRVRNNAVIMIDRPQFRIGRDPGVADYIITDNTAVGRQHADIVQHDGQCFVVDLNSTNHTFVNGQQVYPGTEYPLHNGDQLMLGDDCFQVEIH